MIGAPLVVAGAYFMGLRGGVAVALWATLVATIAYSVVHQGNLGTYIVTVIGYLVVGVLVGLTVDRFGRQKRRVGGRRGGRRGWRASTWPRAKGATASSSSRAPTPCTCTASTPPASPPGSWPSMTRPVRCWATRAKSFAA